MGVGCCPAPTLTPKGRGNVAENIRTLTEDASVQIAVHEDGHVVLVFFEGDEEEAWVIDPTLAAHIGEGLFKAAQEGKANVERRGSG